MKNDGGVKSATSIPEKDRGSSTALDADLEKQLQAWKVNPSWVDQSPEIKVEELDFRRKCVVLLQLCYLCSCVVLTNSELLCSFGILYLPKNKCQQKHKLVI